MLLPRIIPCLLIKDKRLVKTVKFANARYVGAVRILNEKEVDELIVLDIDASRNKTEPDYKMIENLAGECRMPLCYGGGVKTVEQVQRIVALGVEKVAMSSAAVTNPELIIESAHCVGNQSIVVVMDVKQNGDNYCVWIQNGEISTGETPVSLAMKFEACGVGEIVLNSIDHDGLMNGYDYSLIDQVRASLGIPVTALGGAGSLRDIGQLISRYGIIGAAAGSLFIFKGIYKAVLISYPDKEEKDTLIDQV